MTDTISAIPNFPRLLLCNSFHELRRNMQAQATLVLVFSSVLPIVFAGWLRRHEKAFAG